MKKTRDTCLLLLLEILYITSGVLSVSAPVFTTLPNEETIVLRNAQISLRCSASGVPSPKVVNWLHDDKPVNFASSLYTLKSNGDLHIAQAQEQDSGYYQCVARNSVGGIASEKRKLIVAYFDRVTRPSIERLSENRYNFFSAKPPSSVKCNPEPNYIWKKNGQLLQESDRIMVTEHGELFITTLELGDQGKYSLTIENPSLVSAGQPYASQLVREIEFSVEYGTLSPPNSAQIVYTSEIQYAGELKTSIATLECFTTGMSFNRIQISWQKVGLNNQRIDIPVNTKYVRKQNDRRLLIYKPTYEADNGKYVCRAMYNLNELAAKTIELHVFAPPTFAIKPEAKDAFTDNSTELHCGIRASPSFKQWWYRNGIPVVPDQKYVIMQNNTLKITELNWADNGIFQCGAENFAALNFAQVVVKVQNISARIENEFRDIFVGKGTDVIVPCVVVGAPKPTVYWTLNATRISLPRDRFTLYNNGSIVITDFRDTDSGLYECVADNVMNVARRSCKVFAVVATKFIEKPERETSARKGADIELPCKVEHDPNINYTREWRHNNIAVADSRYIVQEDGSLKILFAKDRDTGIDFSCHIFSAGGNISVYTTLVLKQLPREPSAPRDIEIEAYEIKLTWDVPSDGGSPLIEYILSMCNHSDTSISKEIARIPATKNVYAVRNLQAGARYKFKVAAVNKFGRGDWSYETDWIQTHMLAPSAAPYGFQAVDAGTDFVSLAWVIPRANTHNGELKGFLINYRLASSNSDFAPIKVVGGKVTSYRMAGLPIFTEYEVRIAAYNDAGVGPWSSIQFIETKQGIPTVAPSNVSVSVLNASAVEVYFNTPPQEFWNGKLVHIIASMWPPNRPQDQQEYRAPYDHRSLRHQTFVLPNLEPDTEYTLAVRVATTGGSSPGSSFVQFKTSEGVPDAVRDLQVSGIYSDAFSVSWKKPEKPAGQIRGYRTLYRRFNIGAWKSFDEGPLVLGAVVKSLQPRTRYEVKVAAFTSKGVGSYMSASVTTIESPVLPTAPSNLKAYNTWGTVISLGWTPGNSGRAVILHYLIEYNNDTDYHRSPERAVWRVIRNLTKILENPANLTHLRPSTTYRFRMTAYNRVGYSPVSNISEDITTGEGIPSRAPTAITSEAPEVQTLLIKWIPPPKDSWNSGSIKYQFHIKLKGEKYRLGEKPVYKELADTQATQYFARGLKKYSMYNVTMRLFNHKGFGPWSKPIFARTSEDFPSGAPSNVRAKYIDSSSIRVSWGPVSEELRNGYIKGYKVFYRIKGIPETELFKDFPGNETFTGIIGELVGFTDYEIQVMAYTKVGGKFRSNPVTEKTDIGSKFVVDICDVPQEKGTSQDVDCKNQNVTLKTTAVHIKTCPNEDLTILHVPGKPRDVRFDPITYSLVTVHWNSPARPNGDILFYDVKYRENVTGARFIQYERPIRPFQREALVRGLKVNAVYRFEIRAKSAAGWGEPAVEYLLVTTDRYKPESPVILQIPLSSVRTRSIVLRWRPRFNGNSPIRAYKLQFSKRYETWKTYMYGIPPVEHIPASVIELEVKRLEPGTSYRFRVLAINDLGESPWSDLSKKQTTHPEANAGAPYDARILSKTQTSMLVAWDPPNYSTLTGQLRGYKIKYKRIGGIGEYKEFSLDLNTLQYRMTNLKVFQAYRVQIGAFNEEGFGTWTPEYEWRTGEAAPLAAPSNVKVDFQGSSKVRVSWISPDLESVRGYILGFKIESVRLGGRRKRRSLGEHIRERRALTPTCTIIPASQTHLAGPFTNAITLRNLQKYTRYAITVRVYNTFGDGPKSTATIFTTPKDVPGPPYILSHRVYTNLVDVDFAPPCQPNGEILGYKIQYREIPGNFFPATEYSRDEMRIRVERLKPETSYSLELSAKTSAGYGLKATIDFHTKKGTRPPSPPKAPAVYENKPAVLTLKWEEGDNGNLPIRRFYLRYRTADTGWVEYRPIDSREVRYDDSFVVFSMLGLKNNQGYYFQVRSETQLGISGWSPSSLPIMTAAPRKGDEPIYEKMWFIFLMVIIVLLIIIATAVCCWYYQCRKDKYKPNQPYPMSSFQMAMVNTSESESQKRLIPESRNGSAAPSVSSRFRDNRRPSDNSIVKSIGSSDKEPDLSDSERRRPDQSIANHYNNDPFHKNWRDSMDRQTKKALLADFARRPSQASVNTLDKKRFDSDERLDAPSRPRNTRPGRPDLTERKKLARSDPSLEQVPRSYAPNRSQPRPARPGKRQIDHELARSEPDLNRLPPPPDNQVSRAPSFLRATARESDENESFQDVYDREKTKRELAMEYDNRMDNYYPGIAPPPYEYAAPPAYSPSDQENMSDDMNSERNYPVKQRPYIPPKPRLSDFSDSSDSRQPPSARSYNRQPSARSQDRGYFNPEKEYNSSDARSPAAYTPEPRYAPEDRFLPPQVSRFDDELYEDGVDGYEPDMTLV